MRGVCSGAAHLAGHGRCLVKVCLGKGARWLQPYIHCACPIPKKLAGCCGDSVVCGGAALLWPDQGWGVEQCIREELCEEATKNVGGW